MDTVLYFEGDPSGRLRVLRAVKNRYGPVNELGVFAMTERGLKEVSNPSAIFLSRHDTPVAGSVIMVTREGTRPLLVEIQALVDECHGGHPRRVTLGLEQNRLAMLLAVLHRHGGVAMYDQDVYVNAVGGCGSTRRGRSGGVAGGAVEFSRPAAADRSGGVRRSRVGRESARCPMARSGCGRRPSMVSSRPSCRAPICP